MPPLTTPNNYNIQGYKQRGREISENSSINRNYK
jgi:hypothetical protein